MAYLGLTDAQVDVDAPGAADLLQQIKDNLDYLYSVAGVAGSTGSISNGSFEIDSDSDGEPDSWTFTAYTGGSGGVSTTSPCHGAYTFEISHPGGASNGGGYLDSTDYYACSATGAELWLRFSIRVTNPGSKNMVQIRYFTEAFAAVSTQTLHSSTSDGSTWAELAYCLTVPATARWFKIRLIGGYTDTDVAGDICFDNVSIERIITSTHYVRTTMLDTATGTVSTGAATPGENLTLPGGEYGFYPRVWSYGSGVTVTGSIVSGANNTSAATLICLASSTGALVYASQRYITASGKEYWCFLKWDTTAGKIIASYDAPEHPAANNGGDPSALPHPFWDCVTDGVPAGQEIICLDMASVEIIRGVMAEQGISLFILALEWALSNGYEINFDEEMPWIARDMDGTNSLTEQSATWKHRQLRRVTE